MISQNLVVLLAAGIPVLLLLWLRTNAAIVFLSLCAGSVLVKFVGDDASLVGAALGNNNQIVSQYAQLALLLIPVVLTALILRKSVTGPKGILNVLPAIGVGLVGVLLVVPLLPGGVQSSITATNGWKVLEHNRSIVVGASVFVSLLALWVSHRRGHHDKKKKHHK